MKRLIIILICTISIFIVACDSDMPLNRENNNSQEDIDDGINGDSDNSELNDNEYLMSIEKTKSLNTSDILETARSFAVDILTEDFERLDKLYLYSDIMKETMSQDKTKKNIVFYNLEMGTVETIHEPYTYNYGNSRYVIVPIEASLTNTSILISFNKSSQISSFSYEEYQAGTTEKQKKIPEGVVEEEVSFKSDELLIHGTFTSPTNNTDNKTYPLVVLVHGFGASDRDSSIFENKPFQDIAWGLAQAGISSYRYDKRTYVDENAPDDPQFSVYEETINDAVAATSMAKGLKNVDPNKVYVLGASQGGYLIPRIAENLQDIAGYILVSSPAQHRKDYLQEQYEYLAMEDGAISLEEHTAIDQLSEQVALLAQPHQIPDGEEVLGFKRYYWLELNTYDPIQTASTITAPVIVLQGERDYQTTMKQYNLWVNAFSGADNWTFKSYPDLNHFMMKGEGNSYSEEYRQKNYVDGQVIQDIANFVFTN